MKKHLLLLTLILTSTLYCQQFKLTNINSTQYSIDKIAQQVYFKDSYTDTVRKVDLSNLSVSKTNFLILPPILSNKLHLMVYRDSLFDLDKRVWYKFNDSQADSFGYMPEPEWPGSFSPNDSNLIYGNTKYYIPLNDSSLKPVETNLSVYGFSDIIDAWPQWSSDTSFVFLSGGNPDSVITEYFLKSRKIDTLLTTHGYLSGFSYNKKYKILAYSMGTPSKIYFHYVKNNFPDSLIFVLENQTGIPEFTALRWSPDDSKLAFVCTRIDIGSEIYIYDLDSNKVYSGGDGGYIDHIKWANNDTLIFVNETQYILYGLNVSSIYTSVREVQNKRIPNEFLLSQNYPNPFNPSTTIQYEIPASLNPSQGGTLVQLKVYDVLGREVKILVNQYQKSGKYKIKFDAANFSSGVYFYQLKTSSAIIIKKMLLIR